MHTRLAAAIHAARLAVTGHAAPPANIPAPAASLPLPTAGTWKGQEGRVRLTAPPPPREASSWGTDGLPDISLRLLEVMRRLAGEVLRARGQERATVGVFHLPAELVAAHLRVSRPTLYAHLRRLAALGLLDYRGHRTTSERQTRCSGTVWAVSMRPGQEARVRWWDLRHDWRDLDADRYAGRTAWAALQSGRATEEGISYRTLRAWSLGDRHTSDAVEGDCKAQAQEVVWALPSLPGLHPLARFEAITQGARALAVALRDEHSARLYGYLIHRAAEVEHAAPGTLARLAHALQRSLVDAREAVTLQRPGALLVSRLRFSGLWDHLTA